MIKSELRKKAQNFLEGNGVDLDVDKAVHLLLQGANSGESACYYDLAETYFDGVPEDDPVKAMKYLEAAGNTGHGKSCALMARLYSNESVLYSPEDLVRPNPEIAFEWCSKGSELNDPECMLKMARYYQSTGDSNRSVIIAKNALDVIERNELDAYEPKEYESLKKELSQFL